LIKYTTVIGIIVLIPFGVNPGIYMYMAGVTDGFEWRLIVEKKRHNNLVKKIH
jgi:hypothetical protein